MNVSSNYENLVKILILGDSSVGKTNFLFRFTENSFMENYINTIGFDFKSQLITLNDNKTVKLQIWDTAGQERYMSITKNLVLRVQGIVLMYDISTRSTFDHVSSWIHSIRDTSDCIPIIIVGNKSDLEAERVVSTKEGERLAKDFGVQFQEASAKENISVRETFFELTKIILNSFDSREMGNLSLRRAIYGKKQEEPKGGCCS